MMGTESAKGYEKLVSAVLVVVVAAAGWGPFLTQAWNREYVERPLLLCSLAMALLTLGLVHDAADKLFQRGRGIYAAALFCSLPATGAVVSHPGALADGGLMLMISLSVWLAAHAQRDERPHFLIMLAALVLAGGYLASLTAGVFAFLFSIWMVSRLGPRPVVVRLGLMLALIIGVLARQFLIPLPILQGATSVSGMPGVEQTLFPLLPWTMLILPLLPRMMVKLDDAPRWAGDAAGVILLVLVAALIQGLHLTTSAAAAAPTLAIAGTQLVFEEFGSPAGPRRRTKLFIPALIAAVVLAVVAALATARAPFVPALTTWQAGAALVLAAALVWTEFHRLPRWTFALLFISGMLFGRWMNAHPLLFPETETASPPSVWAVAATAALSALAWWTVDRAIKSRRALHVPDEEMLFGGENFRDFSTQGRVARADQSSALYKQLSTPYSFLVFGDVTGAESPLSSRRAGFLAFRALVRRLHEIRPTFAISLGDLAAQATAPAYRRLARLLKRIPCPLSVTPGNHDLFRDQRFDMSLFHELFGADNAAFCIGPVQFVLLNNALGSVNDRQFEWLELQIGNSLSPFILVFCHKPPFEPRDHTFYAMENREDADRLHALFRRHAVTAAFAGHIHSLLSEERDGITYVVSGGGGSRLTTGSDQYHCLRVDVTDEEVHLRALPLMEHGPIAEPAPLLELRFRPRA